MLEQEALEVEPATEAGERSVGADREPEYAEPAFESGRDE